MTDLRREVLVYILTHEGMVDEELLRSEFGDEGPRVAKRLFDERKIPRAGTNGRWTYGHPAEEQAPEPPEEEDSSPEEAFMEEARRRITSGNPVCFHERSLEPAGCGLCSGFLRRSETDEFEALLKQIRVETLYHITALGNVDQILETGLIARRWLEELTVDFTDVSLSGPQQKRAETETGTGTLREHVPLFFNPRNPMQYKVMKDRNAAYAILGIDPKVLCADGVVIFDGNAVADLSVASTGWEELPELPWDMIHDRGGWSTREEKVRRQAEADIPDQVPPVYMRTVYVGSYGDLRELESVIEQDIPIEHEPDLFY